MKKLLGIGISLLFAGSVLAQNPVLEALDLVPASAITTSETSLIIYGDSHAAIRGSGLEVPANWASRTDEGELFTALPGGLADKMLMYLNIGGPDYAELVGFDFFDISRTVTYGNPPAQAMVLLGNFDPAAVTAAFTDRGYTADQGLLCPANGCDAGMAPDLFNRDPRIPFGGDLGRSELVYVSETAILSSPDEATTRQLMATEAGSELSLADLPEVRAITEAMTARGQVTSLALGSLVLMAGTADPLAALEGREQPDSTATLPPYSIFGFANIATPDGEISLVALSYLDEDSASAAADAITLRLSEMSSRDGRTYAELYASLFPGTPEVVSGEHPVTIVPFQPDAYGTGFRMLYSGLLGRDLGWLDPLQ